MSCDMELEKRDGLKKDWNFCGKKKNDLSHDEFEKKGRSQESDKLCNEEEGLFFGRNK
jgi:hypothetical protein